MTLDPAATGTVTVDYQWLANDGTDDSEIAGATDATYEVAAEDAGKTLTVRVPGATRCGLRRARRRPASAGAWRRR